MKRTEKCLDGSSCRHTSRRPERERMLCSTCTVSTVSVSTDIVTVTLTQTNINDINFIFIYNICDSVVRKQDNHDVVSPVSVSSSFVSVWNIKDVTAELCSNVKVLKGSSSSLFTFWLEMSWLSVQKCVSLEPLFPQTSTPSARPRRGSSQIRDLDGGYIPSQHGAESGSVWHDNFRHFVLKIK